MTNEFKRNPGRRGRTARITAPVARQVNYRQLRNPFSPQEIFTEEDYIKPKDDTVLADSAQA